MDICIQIGNTDNKLSQQKWSSFCRDLQTVCSARGEIHFSGGSAIDAPWQNYCICLNVNEDAVDEFRECIKKLRTEYAQDSAAWLQGTTNFV